MNNDFDFDFLMLETEENMSNAIKKYQSNMNKISVGRANPQILNSIMINYFDSLTPLNQIANISVPEPRQLLIRPYDVSINKDIVGAINSSSLGINAINEGDKSRINFPEMTSERRRELVKALGQYTEQARINIRNCRQEANKQIKSSDQSEDVEKRMHDDIQKLTDKYILIVDEETKKKQNDLTTI